MRTGELRLLIVAPSWVGDMMMAQSLLKVLKHQHPRAMIDVLAPTHLSGLLQRMPEVHDIIPHNFKHRQLDWRARYRLGMQLRAQQYQQAIVLPNSWKSALIPFWANIPQRTGYLGEWRYGVLNDIRASDPLLIRQTVKQYVHLAAAPGHTWTENFFPHPHLSPAHVEYTLQKLRLTRPKSLLILCPGAEYGLAKQWAAEYFAIVGKRKAEQGWQVWILGAAKEAVLGAKIAALSGDAAINLCGETQLGEAVDLLSLATAVVTNDSGLMHVAAALNKPLIAIYGSSDSSKTPPLTQHAKILETDIDCRPCFQRTCPRQHYKCLREIKPQQVLQILDDLH
jgi:heptosyltransferase-2